MLKRREGATVTTKAFCSVSQIYVITVFLYVIVERRET